jgi:uncharacterized membrane protein YdbT with pleckstrin-like domain
MKGYVDNTLGKNEAVLFRAHFPWVYPVTAWFVLCVSLLMGIISTIENYNWPAVLIIAVGLILFSLILYPIWTTAITVTNQRFIYRRGLVSRATHELQLRSVEEVNLQQGVIGRMFDCGRLSLNGTGVDTIELPLLADPLGLRKALQTGMAAAIVSPGATSMNA